MASKVSASRAPAWLFCQIRRTVLKLMFTPAHAGGATRQLLLCDNTILCEFPFDAERLAPEHHPSSKSLCSKYYSLFVSVMVPVSIRAMLQIVIISKMVLRVLADR